MRVSMSKMANTSLARRSACFSAGRLEFFNQSRRDVLKGYARRMFGFQRDQWRAAIAALAQLRGDRKLAEKRHAQITSQACASAMTENLMTMPALSADVVT